MEITPVSSVPSSTDRWMDLRDRLDQWARARAAMPTSARGGAPATPEPPPAPEGIEVRVGEHDETGTPTYRVVEAESGTVLAQYPAEKVLDVVAGLLALMAGDDTEGASDVER